MNETLENNHLIPSIDPSVLIYPVKLDLFCSISHLILIIFGTPLNLIVIIVLLISKRLKQKPRNILFLGVCIASLLSLANMMFELIANHFQSTLFCKLNGLCSGVPYTCLLKFLLLALLDRYLAITRPLLHRKIVTVRNVRIIQIVVVIVVYFVIKWPVIFGFAPLQCGSYLLIEAKTLAMHQSMLILLCFVFYVLVYFKTKHCTRPNRFVSVSFVNNHSSTTEPHLADGHVVINSSPKHSEPSPPRESMRIQSNTSLPLQVHGGSRKMEVEATYTLLSGVASLLIFSAPVVVVFFFDWGCNLILRDAAQLEKCAAITASFPYLRELLFYHLIYNPILYMIRSKEFSSTLTEKWMRIIHRHQPNLITDSVRNRRQTPTLQVPTNNTLD